jgi:hypothetical protein
MNDVFSWDPHPHANGTSTCTTITDCRVPFADPLRGATGMARYRIQGEQVSGCWLGTLVGLERSPAQAEVFMPQSIGGCVSWQ